MNESFVDALARELHAEVFAMEDGTFVVDIRLDDGGWVTGLVHQETMNECEVDWAELAPVDRERDVAEFAALLMLELDGRSDKQWPIWLA